MLDKRKIYRIYSGADKPRKNQSPQYRFRRVNILFEDGISFYVESLIDRDSRGHRKRYSIKKHCFYVEEIIPKKIHAISDLHFGDHIICPFCAALGDSVIEKRYRFVLDTQIFNLIAQADLVVVNSTVWKNRYGPVGREADKDDYEKADLIIKNGKLIRGHLEGI